MERTRLAAVLTAAVLASALGCQSTERNFIESDVCVFGGTSAGVAAAVETARLGKRAVIIDRDSRLGGMSTAGLGATDIGNKKAIGGISREFYKRLGKHYGKDEAWTFEPHAAAEVFAGMVREAGIQIVSPRYNHHDFVLEIRMDGDRIVEVRTTEFLYRLDVVNIFRAKMFIDATYEGDLMARAKVTYTVGREPNSKYGETLNGVRARTPKHQFEVPVDPYVRPGDPSSGLLPEIQPGDLGEPGSGDRRVQAYNFRLCLTRDPANRIPIAPLDFHHPKDGTPIEDLHYDPSRYELLARYLEALTKAGRTPKLGEFLSIIEIPNGKTDINNNGAFSTDYLGGSWEYPEADRSQRWRIRKRHEAYTRGFLHFLATSPRVPESLRKEMGEWGLCKDEFVDSFSHVEGSWSYEGSPPLERSADRSLCQGWPPQLYIREARRMVADYVMTEHDCRGEAKAEDPVGLGAYNMDSHNCRRIVRDGHVENEGDVQVGVSPYPISYRSIVPRRGECANLLVPVCLSATHIAYGSIRMEPVFMILGQSAAAAACLAIDADRAVQDVDYGKLRERLLADGQVLEWK